MRNPTVETPTNRGERVKRCPNEIRAYMYDPSVLLSFLHSFLASFSTTGPGRGNKRKAPGLGSRVSFEAPTPHHRRAGVCSKFP